jgi:anti-anti-sigma factor
VRPLAHLRTRIASTEWAVQIRDEKLQDVTILIANGRFDSTTSSCLSEDYASRAIADSVSTLAIDLSGVELIRSARLRVLLHAAKSLKPAARKISLYGLCENIMSIFEMVGFTSLFEIYTSRNAAIIATS